jgi:RNA polymerase sigma-70 factor (ECF subfamily)
MAETPPSLLHRLREAPEDADAWGRFDAIYRPLLTAWLRRHGPQPHDVDNLVQEILACVVRELPGFRYEPARGRFRGWLRQVMVNRLREFWRARQRERASVEPLLEQLEDPASDLSRRWDREHDQHVLAVLLARLEPDFTPTSWEVFRRLQAGEEPKDVSSALGMPLNAVYLARSRILRRLREAAQELVD